jgi:hypothetical protein
MTVDRNGEGITFRRQSEHTKRLPADDDFLHDDPETVDVPRLGALLP